MEYLSKLSERLKDLMSEKEIKTESFASDMGIASSAIRAWLRGDKLPSMKNALFLADYFYCSLDYLTGKEDKFEEVHTRPLPPLYKRIRSIMKNVGVTRYNITHHSSIKDSHFVNWAKGGMPTLPSLCILADYLHVTLDYLVGRTDY